MPKFKAYNYQQTELIALNFEDQLQPGTFEYALHYLIEHKADLSFFHERYCNDDTGRSAYDPAILLKIILFAYSKGITSSREIQWCCQFNILFKALSCNTVPHFTTIAAFISEQPEAIEQLFSQVLLVCYQEGLLGNELFAIDGCKMSSDAAKQWSLRTPCPHATFVLPCTSSGTHKELREKRDKLKKLIRYHMKKHKEHDQSETKDDDKHERLQQTIQTLEGAYDKIGRFLDTEEPRMGKGKYPKEVKSNITDNDSAKMKTSKGTIQGYNGVATVDKKHQVIVDAQAFGEGQEHHVLQPVLESTRERFNLLGISENIYQEGTIVTADTGYANEGNMQYVYEEGIDAYIPDNQFRSRDPKFKEQKQKYGKRNQHIKKNKGTPKLPASEFKLNPVDKTCRCPAGELMWLKNEGQDKRGNDKLFFEGRLTKCRHCPLKGQCMENPSSADTRKGHGRQVSFIIKGKKKPKHTEWMKQRVDSEKGKEIYSHRMSVVGN